MPVGRGSSKVYSPFSVFLFLATVTIDWRSHPFCYCSSLDDSDRAREHFIQALPHSCPKEAETWPGHSQATGTNDNLTQRHSFSNESSGVALFWFWAGDWSSKYPHLIFSLEAPPNPGRPSVDPRGPLKGTERGPGTASGGLIPSRSYNAPDLPSLPFNPTSHPPCHSLIYSPRRFLSSACLQTRCHPHTHSSIIH